MYWWNFGTGNQIGARNSLRIYAYLFLPVVCLFGCIVVTVNILLWHFMVLLIVRMLLWENPSGNIWILSELLAEERKHACALYIPWIINPLWVAWKLFVRGAYLHVNALNRLNANIGIESWSVTGVDERVRWMGLIDVIVWLKWADT